MSNIIPKGEKIRRSVRWISERRKEAPDQKLTDLINKAASRFDLDPAESESLYQFYKDM